MDKINPKFKDKDIYVKSKKDVLKIYKKHSAYRSMAIMKRYKELGGRIDESKDKTKSLSRWNSEKWKNLSSVALGLTTIKGAPKCGVKHPKQNNNKSICRPTVKKSKSTPKLAQTLSKTQIKKAQKLKNLGLRIEWNKL